MPSNPAHLSLAAVQPPMWLSVTVPVSGDLVTTAMRPLIFTSVPDSGPVMKQSKLSGENGSTSGPLSNTYLTPRPRAPTYLRTSSLLSFSYSTLPELRSTLATRLLNPVMLMLHTSSYVLRYYID